MRWLLVKDLQILRRSPLLVALLVIYPLAIAALIGLALSRGPDKPRVAILNQIPQAAETIQLGRERIDISKYSRQFLRRVEDVRVSSREEALRKVRDGDVLGALIIPPDVPEKLQGGLEPATLEVYYNADDPVKERFVRDVVEAQVHAANTALSRKFSQIALGYLHLIVTGGRLDIFGRTLDVLGLAPAEQILRHAQSGVPRGSPARAQLAGVIRFARLARENLDLSDQVLATVGSPIRVSSHIVKGGSTALTSFGVAIAVSISLMFVTVLLAAGVLALEREENAFDRLMRGLVSRPGLLVEKAGLSALCALAVTLLMLGGLTIFMSLAWGRFHYWLAALVLGALAFAALGLAIGALAREVRAASLLAFMLAIPLAFLALVPSGTVSRGLFDVTRLVSGLFPFRATLDAMNYALNGAGGFGWPLAHLALLAAGFGAITLLGLRRFGAR